MAWRSGTAWLAMLRGAGRLPLWPKDRDRFTFLLLLRRALQEGGLACHGFCLLGAEAWLAVSADSAAALDAALGPVCRAYATYWRRWYPGRPRLFEPARAAAIPPGALWGIVAQLETAPVRAGLCGEAWQHRWSSAAAHCALGPSYLPLAREAWEAEWTPERWIGKLRGQPRDWKAVKGMQDLLARARPLRALAGPDAPAAPGPLLQARPRAARAAAGAL